jgi:hypothetical protein
VDVSTASAKKFSLIPKPAPAWAAILGLVAFTVLGIAVGLGNILRLSFPIASLAVGLLLYYRYPVLYVGFTWWMWFLSPLAARLVDYRSGSWDERRTMLLGAYLVTSIAGITFMKYLPKANQQGTTPFVLAALGIAYGFLVSAITTSPFAAIRALFDWLPPVFFGFHLLAHWRHYPQYRQNLQRVFLWGMLLMGIYGCFQFLVAPEWDRFWLVNTKIFSFGTPEPLGMRVWSTMKDPGTFAIFLIPGLILVLTSVQTLRFPVSAAGYLAFLLTRIRTAWLGWLVALLFLLGDLRSSRTIRTMVNIFVIGAIVFPLAQIEPFASIIRDRLLSFSNIEDDTSYTVRQNIYAGYFRYILYELVGRGIGNGVTDSGSLDILISLGLIGTLLFVGGILLLVAQMFRQPKTTSDSLFASSKSICMSVLAMLLSSNTLIAPSGLLFWGFSALSVAGYKYYAHQAQLMNK